MESKPKTMTIGDVVDSYLFEKGYEGREGYPRLLNIAINGMKELHYDATGITVWRRVFFENGKRIEKPKDMLNLIAFWLITDGGLVYVPTNPTQSRTSVDACGKEYLPPTDRDLWYDDDVYSRFSAHITDGRFTGGVFRGPGVSDISYVYNEAVNAYEFSSDTPDSLVAQYMSSPQMVNGKYVITPLATEALKHYMWWAENRFRSDVSETEKSRMQRTWLNAKLWAKMRVMPKHPLESRASRSANQSLTPK